MTMNFRKSDPMEWEIAYKDTLILKRKKVGSENKRVIMDIYSKKTILEESYQLALLKNAYHITEELQYDLDQFLYFYNFQRTHQGYRSRGSKSCDLLYKCGDYL
jgi:hypothetical protein